MRNFRNAAVASATAAALVLGGATVATADEQKETSSSTTTEDKSTEKKDLIFAGKQKVEGKDDGNWPNSEHKDKNYFATDHFGEKTDVNGVPDWARWWVDSSIVGAIGAVIGLIIAGVNYASYNGWIKL
ncbi:hypothetical protein [Corynebacterium riegelii]|uniref:hypothetical protein n=1 Tax=Corynebacterium riegelii TaxID=156976 RepID=UPI00191CBFBF|nr:hypothetical protein [Corynebacterium riegelii]QQU83794.1 hypothetical protein I6I71_10600 [Corynebacterium riegelii]